MGVRRRGAERDEYEGSNNVKLSHGDTFCKFGLPHARDRKTSETTHFNVSAQWPRGHPSLKNPSSVDLFRWPDAELSRRGLREAGVVPMRQAVWRG